MAGDNDDADAQMAAWAASPDDQVAADSAGARSRRRWLRQQARESATLAGVLLTRAERHEVVTVRCGPWTHSGRLQTVTAALCVLHRTDGDIALVPTDAVTVVVGPGEIVDDRPPPAGPDLAGVLATLVGERPDVRLLLADGTAVAGVLVGVGKDGAAVALSPMVASVRLSAIDGCVLLNRGNSDGPSLASGG